MRVTAKTIVTESTWLVEPLRRGHDHLPHLYPNGSSRSVCAQGNKPKKGLEFDFDTRMTVEVDPGIGERQHRRACGFCECIFTLVRDAEPSDDGQLSPKDASGPFYSASTRISATAEAGFVVTRVLGTDDSGTARFEVDSARSTTGRQLAALIGLFTYTADWVLFIDREPATSEELRA